MKQVKVESESLKRQNYDGVDVDGTFVRLGESEVSEDVARGLKELEKKYEGKLTVSFPSSSETSK